MSEKSVIVTGGAGFVGSNLVKKLNQSGVNDIIIVDNYDDRKFSNIKNCRFTDYISYKNGIKHIEQQLDGRRIGAVLHIGANADVLVKDAEVMMHSNFEHSKFYLNLCLAHSIPFIYASSSAVYGNSERCTAEDRFEHPHNVYSWSKWMFDKHVLNNLGHYRSRVIGLRFFNIFGMGEFHKDKNASLPYRFYSFIEQNGFIDLFDEQIARDYVWVEDVTGIITAILNDHTVPNGIYNLGSGNPVSHHELAQLVAEVFIERGIKNAGEELIRLRPMPEELKDSFQFYTKAEDLPAMIARHTAGNKEKIRQYIHQLISISQQKKESQNTISLTA